jgi:hypothetical protein
VEDNAYPYNNIRGISLSADTSYTLIENSHFSHLYNSIMYNNDESPDAWDIARNNEFEKIRNDVFILHSDNDSGYSNNLNNLLITNNYVHDKKPLNLHIKSQSQEPFDLSQNRQISFFHSPNTNPNSVQNETDYDEYYFSDLTTHAQDPSAVTVDEIIEAIENSGVEYDSEDLYILNDNGYLKFLALHGPYWLGLYVEGSANNKLNFKEEGIANAITGAGYHSDFIQFHGHQGVGDYSDIIIRNNLGLNNQGQQILSQSGLKNYAVINNILDTLGEDLASVLFFSTKSWAQNKVVENALVEFNTIVDSGTQLGFRDREEIEWINVVARNNLISPSSGVGYDGEPTEEGTLVDYNLYDLWETRILNSNSLDINTDNQRPNAGDRATFFSDVTYQFVEHYGIDSQGDFHLAQDSQAIGFANTESGINYDIDFLPRDSQPDAGAREYR